MCARRGCACHLPVGEFAVRDPGDAERWTFWRVVALTKSGSRKALRTWPPHVRWAPERPPYPPGLESREERRDWSDGWYETVYWPWKDAVVAEIAARPVSCASDFAEFAPDAELPPPPPPRKRARPIAVRKRARPIAVRKPTAKQTRVAEERLIANALRLAGLSFAEVGETLGLPKTTAIRRLVEGTPSEKLPDVLAQVMLAMDIERLQERLAVLLVRSATPDQRERLLAQAAGLEALRERLARDPRAGSKAFAARFGGGGV
jgi:hypothetical protein